MIDYDKSYRYIESTVMARFDRGIQAIL